MSVVFALANIQSKWNYKRPCRGDSKKKEAFVIEELLREEQYEAIVDQSLAREIKAISTRDCYISVQDWKQHKMSTFLKLFSKTIDGA